MKLLYRLGFYLVGFSIGLIFLAIIFKGKKTSCNYGPNDRVINNISKKTWKQNPMITTAFDSIAFQNFLVKSRVDFSKSDTQKEDCKTYFLNGYWSDKPIAVEVENCDKSVFLLQLIYRTD